MRGTKRIGLYEHETSVQTELSEGIVEEVEENLRTERLRMPLVRGSVSVGGRDIH